MNTLTAALAIEIGGTALVFICLCIANRIMDGSWLWWK